MAKGDGLIEALVVGVGLVIAAISYEESPEHRAARLERENRERRLLEEEERHYRIAYASEHGRLKALSDMRDRMKLIEG